MRKSVLTDEELIYNIRFGNREALELLYFRYETIFRKELEAYSDFFKKIGYDNEDIKIFMWEVLKMSVNKFNYVEGIFFCFSLKIFHFEIINLYRTEIYYRKNNKISFGYNVDLDEVFCDSNCLAEERYDFNLIINSINELSENEKSVMKLLLKGYSYQEIQKITNLSKKTIEYIISKTRKKLKEMFN